MSAFQSIGFLFSGLPFAILSRDHTIADAWNAHNSRSPLTTKWHSIRHEYGLFTAIILCTVFQEALPLIERVETHVLKDDTAQEVITFIVSFTTSFNMIGVAGAIMAQVAITALSLDNLEDTSWAAEAFFIGSLVTGALSVFFACVVQPAVVGLHSAEEIKDWLSKPISQNRKAEITTAIKNAQGALDNGRAGRLPVYEIMLLEEELDRSLRRNRWKIASPYSAMMLVAPSKLLAASLEFFISGLGIYLGLTYSKNLIPTYGPGGQLAIIIVFAITTVFGLASFFVPKSLKSVESFLDQKFTGVLRELRVYKMDTLQEPGDNGRRGDRDLHRQNDNKAGIFTRDADLEPLAPARTRTDTTLAASSGGVITKPSRPRSPNFTLPRQGTWPTEDGSFQSALLEFIEAQENSARAARKMLEQYTQMGK